MFKSGETAKTNKFYNEMKIFRLKIPILYTIRSGPHKLPEALVQAPPGLSLDM